MQQHNSLSSPAQTAMSASPPTRPPLALPLPSSYVVCESDTFARVLIGNNIIDISSPRHLRDASPEGLIKRPDATGRTSCTGPPPTPTRASIALGPQFRLHPACAPAHSFLPSPTNANIYYDYAPLMRVHAVPQRDRYEFYRCSRQYGGRRSELLHQE